MKIFIILKKKSERVKNKNFVKFNKLELYKKVLYKFKDFEVFVDTDSEKIIREGKKDKKLSHCFFYKRNEEFISMEKKSNKSPTPFMIKNFLTNFVTKNNEIVVTSHVTSPFLKISTLKNALSKMKNYNSVASCIKTQNFAYVMKNEPLEINGPIFLSSGDYEFKFDLRTIDESSNWIFNLDEFETTISMKD